MDTTSGDPIVGTLIRRPTLRLWNVASGEIVGTPMTVTYSFMTRLPDYAAAGLFTEFTDSLKEATRDILRHYESVSGLRFVEVDDAGMGGLIRLGLSDDLTRGAIGRANYPRLGLVSANDVWPDTESGGDVWLDARENIVFQPVLPGGGVYGTLIHEIGHAVGLAHPGNYNSGTRAPPPPPYLPPELDNRDNTIMSYYPGASGGWPAVLGPFDIRALQYAYGLPGPGTIGNMTYGSESDDTIVGTANTDWIHGQGGDDAILLGAGDDGARGVDGNDLILGEAGADTLRGNAGDDLILGGDDDDSINGDEGDDDLNGNLGEDAVLGGDGADFVRGGQGDDLVYGDDGDDWHVNGNIGNDTVHGGGGDDTIFGGPGDDLLIGGDGRDRISGDLGDDTMQGDADGDVFVIGQNHGHDVILGFADGASWIELPAGINGTSITDFATLLARITDTVHSGQASAQVDLGDGNGIVLLGVSRAQVQLEDFVFL
ncbi:hypothetical protein STAQ_14310 [Allostella sp. ATCC 35155]|nr:hypothetical protein STAQ_14310 [Stella sp. ATCC 35155]